MNPAPDDEGHQWKAPFSFRGVDSELDRAAPLAVDESVLVHGALRAREGGIVRSPAVIRLTARRFIVVRHFVFHADLVCEVPPSAIVAVHDAGRGIDVRYRDRDRGDVLLHLTPWSGRTPPARPLRDLTVLRDALRV